jgi:hypothetical protein
LNAAGARYLLIGGFALIAHGAGRTTQDIDRLVDDSPKNVVRVTEVLGVLEDHAARDVRPDDVKTYTVVRVADEVVVDIMGRGCGVTYADAIAAPRRSRCRRRRAGREQAQDREYLEARLEEEDRKRLSAPAALRTGSVPASSTMAFECSRSTKSSTQSRASPATRDACASSSTVELLDNAEVPQNVFPVLDTGWDASDRHAVAAFVRSGCFQRYMYK